MSRGIQVSNPASIVLVDNVSDGIVSLNREGEKTILLKPGETGQLTWSEYVRAKNIPHFGRFIKLNDSVLISNGVVKIKNIITDLTEDDLVEMLVQSVDMLKEFSLELNEGETEIFKSFLKMREKMGIEREKCIELLEFIETQRGKPEDEVEEPKELDEPPKETKSKAKAKPKAKEKPVGKRLDDQHTMYQNENQSSIHIKKTGDGNS